MISGQQLSCTLAVQKDREGMMYRRYTVKQLSELAEAIRIAREKEKEDVEPRSETPVRASNEV